MRSLICSRLGRPGALLASACCALAISAASPAIAQYDSLKIDLMSQVTPGDMGASAGNDCWGYTSQSGREYALMGYNNKMVVFEVTDPANPVVVSSISHQSSTWCDIKVYEDYAYVCNEAGGAIQIVDLSNVDSGSASLVGTFGPSTSHNIAINEDSGFLYTAGSGINGGRPVIYDLSSPTSPVEAGRVPNGVSGYSHDNHIVTYQSGPYAGREILFAANENRGVYVIDVTNKSSITLLDAQSYPGVSYCHQLWTNDDHTILYVNDELDELYGTTPTTRTLVFDVSDLSDIVLVNTFTSGLPASDHNLYYAKDLVWEANYTSGLRVFDASSDPIDPVEVAYFDTYPGSNGVGFDGAWSVYPYFESDTVIVSDINRGLFVLDASQVLNGLKFEYPDGRPELVEPAGGTTFRVEVSGSGVIPEPNTGILHYDDGSGWDEIAMSQVSQNVYDAVFPATICGSLVNYYVSAETTLGDRETDPGNAPASSFSALSASSVNIVFEDDFEVNTGWVVQSIDLTGGEWQRGVPAGDGDRGDPTMDYDGSGSCYLTENGAGNTDVDGGPTRLTSPTIDLSGGDAIISYAKWFTNDDGDDDRLTVEVSNDDGNVWQTVESSGSTGGWVFTEFRVSDYVSPTSTMRVRFSATDNPNDSVTEAAIDAFAVSQADCGGASCLALSVDNLAGGTNAEFTVNGGKAGAKVIVLWATKDGTLDYCPEDGPWCVAFDIDVPLNKAQSRIVVQGTFDGGGLFQKSRYIPESYSGLNIKFQAAEGDTYPVSCMSDVFSGTIQ